MENNTKPNQYESEVDSRLAANWQAQADARARQSSAMLTLGYEFGTVYYATKTRREVRESNDEILALARGGINAIAPWDKRRIELALATYEAEVENLELLKADAADDEAAYEEKQWSRFFLVTNTNGHIHSSMQCSTCNFRTQFAWLPELSGLTEKDAVEAYGPHLCSVCFPSAPVEWTAGAEKNEDPDQCPGSGTYDHDSSGLQYYSPRAVCNHCHRTVSVTSTGKMRKHKKEEA